MLNVVDIRNRGIKAVDEEIASNGMATLTYRGKPKYVIFKIDEYERFKEMELELAYKEAMQEIENGNYKSVKSTQELDKHVQEL